MSAAFDYVADDNRTDNVIAMFEMRAEADKATSKAEGRPIFREVPYITILIPGDRDQVVRRVREGDKTRFARQWEQFEKRGLTATNGTPLEQWPMLGVAQVAQLRALSVLTVEALADLSDAGLAKLGPGGRELQGQARRFLEYAAGTAENEYNAATVAAADAAQEDLLAARALVATAGLMVDVDASATDITDRLLGVLAQQRARIEELEGELEAATEPPAKGKAKP